MRDSTRHGRVLSTIKYATIIDKTTEKLNTKDYGIEIPRLGKLGYLLWVDGVALIHHNC